MSGISSIRPNTDRRSFYYDASTDLFTGEKYEEYPLAYHIDQLGAAQKKLAITFDDGPDTALDAENSRHPEGKTCPRHVFSLWAWPAASGRNY